MQSTIDLIIGSNILRHRQRLGLSQKHLADYLGVSFQQVQKYERGINRVSASKLYAIAKTFGCTMEELCKGITQDAHVLPTKSRNNLLADFSNIANADIRRILSNLIQLLAAQSSFQK